MAVKNHYKYNQRTPMQLLWMLLALAAGMAIASQAAINSALAKGLGGQSLMATTISFATGLLPLLLLCLWKADWSAAWQQLPAQPWWRLTGGLLGAGLVLITVILAPRLGVTQTLFFLIVGQLITAALIDHFGWLEMSARPLQPWQLAGLLLMAGGLVLFVFGKRWFGS